MKRIFLLPIIFFTVVLAFVGCSPKYTGTECLGFQSAPFAFTAGLSGGGITYEVEGEFDGERLSLNFLSPPSLAGCSLRTTSIEGEFLLVMPDTTLLPISASSVGGATILFDLMSLTPGHFLDAVTEDGRIIARFYDEDAGETLIYLDGERLLPVGVERGGTAARVVWSKK